MFAFLSNTYRICLFRDSYGQAQISEILGLTQPRLEGLWWISYKFSSTTLPIVERKLTLYALQGPNN